MKNIKSAAQLYNEIIPAGIIYQHIENTSTHLTVHRVEFIIDSLGAKPVHEEC